MICSSYNKIQIELHFIQKELYIDEGITMNGLLEERSFLD